MTAKPGTLVVGSDIPYVPFEFGEPPRYDGMDMDLLHEIGKRLDVKVVIRKTPFDTIFRDLAQDRFDMVASSVSITEKRKKVVDFSLPYFNADQSVMVQRGSSITDVKDLAGKRVGVQIGGTGELWVKKHLTSSDIRTYDVVDDAFKALAASQVDAVINDFPSSKYAERSYETLKVAATIPTGEQYGLVFPRGSELRHRINQILLEMKRDGAFDRIYRKWFKTAPPDKLLSGRKG
ncbi:MAG: transporter substrate-binding domain-containing protein [Micromonosporaceae bacterium]|nr:transporter substrate-binding domain-containing protein [Micromonosporaceae bacterium]